MAADFALSDILFPIEGQVPLTFPAPLTEKHRPRRVPDLVGIEDAKAVSSGLLASPRPCALLLVGPPAPGLGPLQAHPDGW